MNHPETEKKGLGEGRELERFAGGEKGERRGLT